jgi:hypothetical protein
MQHSLSPIAARFGGGDGRILTRPVSDMLVNIDHIGKSNEGSTNPVRPTAILVTSAPRLTSMLQQCHSDILQHRVRTVEPDGIDTGLST